MAAEAVMEDAHADPPEGGEAPPVTEGEGEEAEPSAGGEQTTEGEVAADGGEAPRRLHANLLL